MFKVNYKDTRAMSMAGKCRLDYHFSPTPCDQMHSHIYLLFYMTTCFFNRSAFNFQIVAR